jgi:poly(beta-D-mannuronate) lyase
MRRSCLILLLLVPSPLPAATTLVRDAAELSRAAAAAKPGDVIELAAGEWRDVNLVLEARGAPDQPITLRAERPGETTITGQSRLRIAGEHLVVSGLKFQQAFHPDAVLEFRHDSKRLAAHCRVTDCAFLDCNPPGETKEDAKYVSIYGRENRLDHCELTGKRTRGTTLVVWLQDETSGSHLIEANYFGPRPELKQNGGETIRIGDSNTSRLNARCVVVGNLFEHCDGESEIISNKSCENVYRSNTFRGCSGALTLRHGHRCRVDGNWFLGAEARGTGGVRVIGEHHRVVNNYFHGLTGDDARSGISLMTGIENSPLNGYSPVVDALIACNTFVDCKQTLLIGLADDDVQATVPPRDCVITANVLTGRRGPLVTVREIGDGVRGESNLVFGAEAGFPPDVQFTTADPRLSGTEVMKRPAPGSPAIGAAAGIADVSTDIDGQPRPGRFDIGCDQASTAEILHRPLHRADVGPSWSKR